MLVPLARQICNSTPELAFNLNYGDRFDEYLFRFTSVVQSTWPGQPRALCSVDGATFDGGLAYTTSALSHINLGSPNPVPPEGIMQFVNRDTGLFVTVDSFENPQRAMTGEFKLVSPGIISGTPKDTSYTSYVVRSEMTGENVWQTWYAGWYTGAPGQRVRAVKFTYAPDTDCVFEVKAVSF